MTKENEQEPKKYQKGDQIWYIDPSHCPYEGECPVSAPCVESARVVSVIQDGQYYGKSGGGIMSAKDMYSTPEAAEASIPDPVNAKISFLKRRIAHLQDALEEATHSHEKWCPLMEEASCYRDCGWYDAARKQCSMISLGDTAVNLLAVTEAVERIAAVLESIKACDDSPNWIDKLWIAGHE